MRNRRRRVSEKVWQGAEVDLTIAEAAPVGVWQETHWERGVRR